MGTTQRYRLFCFSFKQWTGLLSNSLLLTSALEYRTSTSLTRRLWLSSVGNLALTIPTQAKGDNIPFNVLDPSGLRREVFQPFIEGSEWNLPPLYTSLGKMRIAAKELNPLSSSSLFSSLVGENELYYPPFLFGAWDVEATLKRKIFPYGVDVVPSSSLLEGSPRYRLEKVGDTRSYEVHYFSTLANTMSNQFKVNLGMGVPSSKIIADRAFNIRSISRAYQQLTPVDEVIWDYAVDPTRLQLSFSPGALTDDMRPLGPRRGEVYITSRDSEILETENQNVFCAVEKSRTVLLATRSTIVSDIETITEFCPISSDQVHAIQRIAVYLTPNPNSREGLLWQQVGGKAVAFYDYELSMRRQLEDFINRVDGSHQLRACVKTPKHIVQCY